MKNYFADPELKIIRFEAEDICTASPNDPPDPDPSDDEIDIN